MEAVNNDERRERRHYDKVRTAAVIVALVVQFGGIVWGAAKLSASVSHLERAVGNLDKTVEKQNDKLTSTSERIIRLETRLDSRQ
jgi:hypothetical protein